MTTFYKGRLTIGRVAGTARDGRIFNGVSSGLAPERIRATYENGWVYEGTIHGLFGKVIGSFRNGFIYDGHRASMFNVIGRYQDGNIYAGTVTRNIDIVGRYVGSDEEGAALAIYYLFR